MPVPDALQDEFVEQCNSGGVGVAAWQLKRFCHSACRLCSILWIAPMAP